MGNFFMSPLLWQSYSRIELNNWVGAASCYLVSKLAHLLSVIVIKARTSELSNILPSQSRIYISNKCNGSNIVMLHSLRSRRDYSRNGVPYWWAYRSSNEALTDELCNGTTTTIHSFNEESKIRTCLRWGVKNRCKAPADQEREYVAKKILNQIHCRDSSD